MSTMTKVFIVLTSVVAIVLSVLTVATAARWSNQKEQIENYQTLYQSEFVRRANVEALMATSLAMKDDAIQDKAQLLAKQEEAVRKLTDDMATVRTDLARKTNEKEAAEAGRKKIEEMLSVTMGELTGLQKQNQTLLTQNIDVQTRNQRLASRVLELTSQVTIATDEIRNMQEKNYALEQKVKELQQAIASGVRQVTPAVPPTGAVPQTPLVAGPIRGEIATVDGGYVSINIGEASGVAKGMKFVVYRGEVYIGDLEIQTVRPKEAGGKMTLLNSGQEVRRGDRAVYGWE